MFLNKTVESTSTRMYYVLSTKILQGADTALMGLFFKKGILEFMVKILDNILTKTF